MINFHSWHELCDYMEVIEKLRDKYVFSIHERSDSKWVK